LQGGSNWKEQQQFYLQQPVNDSAIPRNQGPTKGKEETTVHGK
jgi:hypothetical protein